MKAEYINPFVSSLRNTFATMLSCEVTRGNLVLKEGFNPIYEISGVIGLSGKAVGTVVVSLSKNVAVKAASTLLMDELTEVNDDVTDAVGELTNMIAGAAKAELEQYELSVSLPNVITGAGHTVRFPSNVRPICVPFKCQWGELTLEVGLTMATQPVEA